MITFSVFFHFLCGYILNFICLIFDLYGLFSLLIFLKQQNFKKFLHFFFPLRKVKLDQEITRIFHLKFWELPEKGRGWKTPLKQAD